MNRRFVQGIARLLISTMLLALALPPIQALAAYEPVYARCNTNNLRIRTSYGSSSAIKGYLMAKDVVWVIEEKKSGGVTYFKIEYVDQYNTRQEGWVAYKSGSSIYFHKFTDSEMQSYSYSNGELPGITGSSSNTGSGSSGSSSGSSSSSSSGSGTYLKLGSKGTAVKELQQALKDMKLYSGDITGSFGQRTEDAVKSFQRKKGLYVDGIAGPSTQAALFGSGSSSSSGSSGTIVDASDLGLTTRDKVHLRTSPSASGTSKSLLPIGTVFEIVSHSRNGNDVWYYIKVDSSKGYIRSDMLYVMTAAEAAAYRQGQNPTPPTTTGGTQPSPTTTPTTGMGRITSDDVNLRSGAGTSNASLGKLNRDTVMTIESSSNNGSGELWYYMTSGSTKGYVRSDFVHVMTQAEIDAHNNNNNNSNNNGSGTVTPPTTYRTLKQGSTGDDVKALQQKLKDLGYYSGSISGSYGSLTAEAVRKFQKASGLYVDGIAGVNTQNKLYGTSSPGSDTANPVINGVYNIPWNTFKAQIGSGINFPNGGSAVLTDVDTNRSFNIIKQSAGYHLDVEPATANDTAVLTALYNGNITYVRRAVWLTVDGKTYAASIYAVGHGTDTLPSNNFSGQFCVHLLNSWTHVGSQEDPDHQKMVQKAYDAAKNKL